MKLFKKEKYEFIDVFKKEKLQEENRELRADNGELKSNNVYLRSLAEELKKNNEEITKENEELKYCSKNEAIKLEEIYSSYVKANLGHLKEKRRNEQLQEENEELKKKIEKLEAEKEIQLLKNEKPEVINISLYGVKGGPVVDSDKTTRVTLKPFNPLEYTVTAKELRSWENEYDTPSNEAVELARAIKREFDKGREKEHKCTKECFEKHVLKAINRDKFYGHFEKNDLVFLRHWAVKLFNEYDFLAGVYYDKRGQVIVTFK